MSQHRFAYLTVSWARKLRLPLKDPIILGATSWSAPAFRGPRPSTFRQCHSRQTAGHRSSALFTYFRAQSRYYLYYLYTWSLRDIASQDDCHLHPGTVINLPLKFAASRYGRDAAKSELRHCLGNCPSGHASCGCPPGKIDHTQISSSQTTRAPGLRPNIPVVRCHEPNNKNTHLLLRSEKRSPSTSKPSCLGTPQFLLRVLP